MNKYLFENDYSADSLRWIKKMEGLNPSSNMDRLNEDSLEALQNEIIKTHDSALAYFFACEYDYKPYRMQQVIVDNKDPKYSYLFAQDIRNADVRALQKIVVESNKTKYICKFACFVRGADVKPLESLIIKSKNVKYAHMYIKHIQSADVNKFKDIIIASKKPRYLFELAKHIRDIKDLALIEDLIIEAKSYTYIRLLADKIKKANVEKLEQALLETNNTEEIKRFAKCVKRSKMKRFFLVV